LGGGGERKKNDLVVTLGKGNPPGPGGGGEWSRSSQMGPTVTPESDGKEFMGQVKASGSCKSRGSNKGKIRKG